MATFDGGKLSDPNTQFQQVKPRARPDAREGQLSALVKGGAAAGKAFAKASGVEQAGGGLSQEEINAQADTAETALDNQITDAMVANGGTIQERTQTEVKDKALTEFATNDRTLLELRDRGVISTLEARGRRQLNLQRALSNPINALFKGEFMQAASSLTGGAKGAVAEAFPFTPAELKQQAISAEQVKATAEFEGKIAGAQAKGIPEAVARKEYELQAQATLELQEFNRIKQTRALNGEEFSKEAGLLRSSASRGLMMRIADLRSQNGGKGLDANSVINMNQTLDQQFRGLLENINTNPNIGSVEREAERKKLETWNTGMKESLKQYDATTRIEKNIKMFEALAQKENWAEMTDVMVANTVNPKFVEIMLMQGGFNKNMDKFVGKGAHARLVGMSARMKSVVDFSEGTPPEDIDVAGIMLSAITLGGTKVGLEYVVSEDVQNSPERKLNLAKIYDQAPEMSLQALSTVDAQLMSPNNEVLREEINLAMTMARDKMNRIKKMVGAEGEVIFAEAETFKTTGPFGKKGDVITTFPGKSPNWVLNLPDGMKEHADDLKAIHRMIVKQPWAWSHVESQYVDGNDAFNGYMRGEFDINVGMEPEPKAEEGLPKASEDPVKSAISALPQASGEGTLTGNRNKAPIEPSGAPVTTDGSPLQGDVPLTQEDAVEGLTVLPTTGVVLDVEALQAMVDNGVDGLVKGILEKEGGYQNKDTDPGNKNSKGELVGTNFGISAPFYEKAIGHPPSEEEMKSITKEQASTFHRKVLKDNGIDKIAKTNQNIVANMMTMTSMKGVGKVLARVEKNTKGRKPVPMDIWVEYEKYLRSLKHPETGDLLWDTYGRGWTNRYMEILTSRGSD